MSPKFHAYDVIVPSVSEEAPALKDTASGAVPDCGVAVNEAMGGILAVVPAGWTVMLTFDSVERVPSEAVSLRVYSPSVLNVAVAESKFVFEKVTVPGPETLLQVEVSEEPAGLPSSVAVPVKERLLIGRVMVRLLPAETVGG